MNSLILITQNNFEEIVAFSKELGERQKLSNSGKLLICAGYYLDDNLLRDISSPLSKSFEVTELTKVQVSPEVGDDSQLATMFATFFMQRYTTAPGPWLVIDGRFEISRDNPVDIAFPSPSQWEYLSDTLGAMPEREYLREGTLLDKDGSQTLIVDRKTKIQALKDIGKWKDSMSRKEEDKVLAANESEIDKKMIEKFRSKMEGKLKGEIDVQESGTWWATVYNKDTNYTRIKNMKEESLKDQQRF